MASPFPGMDPWLEHPRFFPDLRHRLNCALSEQLNANLPDRYFAEFSYSLWIDVPDDEPGESLIQVRTGATERLAAAVNLLSLGDKSHGRQERALYRARQQEVLDGQIHLIEIDLLRGGEHTTAMPHNRLVTKTGPFDYHVCIHRFDRFAEFLVHPIRLRDRLPAIAVPLLPGDGEVVLDLQVAFDRCYENGPYARRVRYEEIEPIPPLSSEDAAWASALLKMRNQEN